MRHDVGLGYSEMIEQRDRVARQRIEMQVALRLGGFSKADLVRHDHAIAGIAQGLDDRRPIARWEIAAVQQHHGAAVRLRGSYVHIGHPHLFAVVHQRQQVDGVGIGKAFEPDAVRLARRGRSVSAAAADSNGIAAKAAATAPTHIPRIAKLLFSIQGRY